jgi:hypothetical protein
MRMRTTHRLPNGCILHLASSLYLLSRADAPTCPFVPTLVLQSVLVISYGPHWYGVLCAVPAFKNEISDNNNKSRHDIKSCC